MASPILTLSGIRKSYGQGKSRQVILDGVDLSIETGEFFLFVGPSGCGKSTLLRIMSGLDKDFQGQVKFADGLFHRDLGFVFQSFALLPWMTVSENVEIGLIARGIEQTERKRAVMQQLEQLGLENNANSYPRELSGGMRQRVGIARALVTDPKLLFLDEPFSELDTVTAHGLRAELLKIWEERNLTVVMVSHIVEECLELSDRIAVLHPRPGGIERILHNPLPRPRNTRSAEFFKMEDQVTELIRAD